MTALTATPLPILEVLDDYLEAVRQADHTADLAPLERKLEIATRRWFRAQSAAFRKRFAGLRRMYEAAQPEDWEWLFDVAAGEVVGPYRDRLLVLVAEAMRLGWERAQAEHVVTIGFRVTNPAVSEYLRTVGADHIAGIDATTKDVVRGILSQAADEGWSYQRTAKELTAKYGAWAAPVTGKERQVHIRSRSQLIAITELGDAYSEADLALAQSMAATGEKMEKAWGAVAGACPLCRANAGQDWIPLADAFSSGHQRPTGHGGCRCDLRTRRVVDGRRG